MSLSDFIRNNRAQIIAEWENFAMTLIAEVDDRGSLTLRDHVVQILDFIMEDMDSPQTGPEQVNKSRGEASTTFYRLPGTQTAAESHADLRLAGGFNLDQMISEYRALRASVVKLWSASNIDRSPADIEDLTRFNESIDQALTESISYYTMKLDHSRDLFLGILSHDMRNPMSAISGAAQLALDIGPLSDRQEMLVNQVVESAARVNEIIGHLMDLTGARFGSGMQIRKAPMDFGFVSRRLVQEMQAVHPDREIHLRTEGKLLGQWDVARIGQVFSNLIGNALQYSFVDTPVTVVVSGDESDVTLSVHNQGVPIPKNKIGRIFDALTRSTDEDGDEDNLGSVHLGLGLYITKEIVTAHGGTIEVTSLERSGTTFTAKFPRA